MATRGPRFTAIPNVPQGGGITDWQFNTMTALKENLELLMGARGADASVRAVLSGQITVPNPTQQRMTQVSATTAGFTIQNVKVPSLDDYTKLVSDVQLLANDVARLRDTVNTLINQLRT